MRGEHDYDRPSLFQPVGDFTMWTAMTGTYAPADLLGSGKRHQTPTPDT